MDFFVIDLHAIVQVQLNAAQGKVGDHFVIVAALFELLLQLFLPLGGSGHLAGVGAVVDHVLHPVDLRLIDALHFVEVIHTEIADGVRRVAVEVDQRLEAVLLAAVEQPVDRALLVGLAVILEKVLEEVAADDLPAAVPLAAQRPGDEVQIFFQRVRAVGGFQPAAQAGDDVVLQILFVGDGQDAIIRIRQEGLVLPSIPVPAGVGQRRPHPASTAQTYNPPRRKVDS